MKLKMQRDSEDKRSASLRNGYSVTIKWHDVIWVLAIALLMVVCLELFYRMIVNYNDKYMSDMHYYVITNAQEDVKNDRLLGFLFTWFYSVNENIMEANIYLAAVVGLTVVANYLVINYLVYEDLRNSGTAVPRSAREIVSLLALFIGPIYVPVIHEWYYRKSFSAYAWQSPTQQSMTLFALIATLCFLKMYTKYEEHISAGWWIASAVMIFITTFTKPSFFFDLVIGLIFMFLYELVAGGRESALSRILRLIVMGCALIPAGVYVLMLYISEFNAAPDSATEESHIVFGIQHLRGQGNIVLMFVCGMAFSIVVLAVNWRKFRDRKYLIAVSIFAAGVLQWALITETGKRANYGNFTWGRVYATYFVNLISATIALENVYDRDNVLSGKKQAQAIYFICLAILLILSVLSQMKYFSLILTGHGYMR